MRFFSGWQHQQPCRHTLVLIAWKKPHDIVILSFSQEQKSILNSVSFKCHSISVTFKFCAVLVALCAPEPRSTDSLGTQHCSNFESHSNRVTFETNAISRQNDIKYSGPILQQDSLHKNIYFGKKNMIMSNGHILL